MARTVDYDSVNPSEDMLERGKRFSQWLQSGLDSSPYKTVAALAQAMKRSRQTLYPYFNDCIAGDGRFRSPGERITKELAAELGLRWETGAAIMAGTDAAPVVVTAHTKSAEPITRIVTEDAFQIVDYYEGLPPGPLRDEAREYMKSLNEASKRAYRRRTDIIGKVSDEDEATQRIPEE